MCVHLEAVGRRLLCIYVVTCCAYNKNIVISFSRIILAFRPFVGTNLFVPLLWCAFLKRLCDKLFHQKMWIQWRFNIGTVSIFSVGILSEFSNVAQSTCLARPGHVHTWADRRRLRRFVWFVRLFVLVLHVQGRACVCICMYSKHTCLYGCCLCYSHSPPCICYY